MKTSYHRTMKFNSTQKYRENIDVYPSISQQFQCQSIYMFSILYDTQKITMYILVASWSWLYGS